MTAHQPPPPRPERGLDIWVIYDHPADFPHNYVARLWRDDEPQGSFVVHPKLGVLRNLMRARGLTAIPRMESDDPVIIEIWL